MMASHRTQQNINNLKIANVMHANGELDFVPRKDRKASIDISQND